MAFMSLIVATNLVPWIQLAERAIEGGLGRHGDDEDVRGDIPRLIGGDAKMHGSNASGKGAGEDR